MSQPLISVIIPTYNRADTLAEAICSVLSQTYDNIELIIVDDGSTDGTDEVLEQFSGQVISRRTKNNSGACAARNLGLKISTAEYVAFLDSDDLWLPNKLEEQFTALVSLPPEYCGVYSGYTRSRMNDRQGRGRDVIPEHEVTASQILGRNTIGGMSCALLRKSAVMQVGAFDESLPASQDWDLWIRLCDQFRMMPISMVHLTYREHSSQISANSNVKYDGMKRLYAKHRKQFDSNSSQHDRANFFFQLGILAAESCEFRAGQAFFWLSFRSKNNVSALIRFVVLFISPNAYAGAAKLWRSCIR